jgi:ABC-type polysaccharide/polyol phosphate transport system ATPase subunit
VRTDRGISPPTAVVADGVSKSFALPRERVHTLKERALHPFRRVARDRLEVLQDVSFAVETGTFFGIVGRNGSGKSTLLKCLAGIYGTDAGAIYLNGRLSTFIELGVGFNPDLAARDNVIMNGIMLGLSPAEARARVDDVIAFAELEEFVDLKLKNYSSGMHVRLAFSVMIQVQADVLLIDEVLAVGDASFQQKCFDVFHDMREQGKTVLLVTHDMGAIERFCDEALLLEHGEVVMIDKPKQVASRYLELAFAREAEAGVDPARFPNQKPRGGDGRARVTEAWIEAEGGKRSNVLMQGDRCTFKALVQVYEPVDDPSFAVAWVNEYDQNHFVASTASQGEHTGRFEAGETVLISLSFANVFAPGRYYLSVKLAHRGSGGDIIDRCERLLSVVVAATQSAGGLVDLPHELTIERAPAAHAGSATKVP